MYSPTFTPARTKRALLAGLGAINRPATAHKPVVRREKLYKRITDLLQSLPLCRMAMQGILALSTESSSSGCRYCGCTCRGQTQNEVKVLEVRAIAQPTHCVGCNGAVQDAEFCEACRSQASEDFSAYVKVEVQSDGFSRLPSITPPRVRVGKGSPVSTPHRALRVSVSAGPCVAQFQGPGPHLCRLVFQDLAEAKEAIHKRSATMDNRAQLSETEGNALEAYTSMQEVVDSLERSKRHFLQPGAADRGLERLLRLFAGTQKVLWRQQPDCAA